MITKILGTKFKWEEGMDMFIERHRMFCATTVISILLLISLLVVLPEIANGASYTSKSSPDYNVSAALEDASSFQINNDAKYPLLGMEQASKITKTFGKPYVVSGEITNIESTEQDDYAYENSLGIQTVITIQDQNGDLFQVYSQKDLKESIEDTLYEFKDQYFVVFPFGKSSLTYTDDYTGEKYTDTTIYTALGTDGWFVPSTMEAYFNLPIAANQQWHLSLLDTFASKVSAVGPYMDDVEYMDQYNEWQSAYYSYLSLYGEDNHETIERWSYTGEYKAMTASDMNDEVQSSKELVDYWNRSDM